MIARAVGTMGEVEAQLAATRVQIDAVMQHYHDECAEAHRVRATIERHEADIAAAAGELLVPIPVPGTVTARLLRANILLRRERDDAARAQQADFDSLYADYVARSEAIDTLSRERDDDARYIVRRHSRRTAGIGLGEIVWCDGGIARTGGDRG